MRYFFISMLIMLSCGWSHLQAQTSDSQVDTLRLMFYNVENLFDPFDDSLTRDEEFTSDGARHWTWNKYQDKISHIYKVIMAAGNPYPPAIIGLCEIENRFVLNQLVYKSPFSKFDYRIVHEESPDRRGIDVGLLFDPTRFHLISHEAIPVYFPSHPNSRTRDILYVKGVFYQSDTVHIFINHWPSRWGGQMATDPKRKRVADILKLKTDSLFLAERKPAIIIMGDFNDYPTDESLRINLKAGNNDSKSDLVNLMLPYAEKFGFGSHKYHQDWGTLDQIIVSKYLLLPDSPLKIANQKAHIFNASFLLCPDEKFSGIKPFRTFLGFKYIGGYSDHLPIFRDVHTLLYFNSVKECFKLI